MRDNDGDRAMVGVMDKWLGIDPPKTAVAPEAKLAPDPDDKTAKRMAERKRQRAVGSGRQSTILEKGTLG